MKIGFAGGPLDGRRAAWDDAPATVISTDIDIESERVVYELRQQIGGVEGARPIVLNNAIYVPKGTTERDALEMIRAFFANMVIGD